MEKEIQNLEKNEIQVSQDDKENNKDLIKLTNVYGADRQIITPGALNSKATFIRARNLDQDIVNKIIVSLVTREI